MLLIRYSRELSQLKNNGCSFALVLFLNKMSNAKCYCPSKSVLHASLSAQCNTSEKNSYS